MGRPGTYDIVGYQGDTLQLTFNFTDANDVPVVLPTTGWRAQIRQTAASETILASFTIDSTDAATGVLVLTLAAAASESLTGGIWDLESSDGGVVRTYLRGTVRFEVDVTR